MVKAARTFLLVHGAWHGGWCWHRVAALLRQEGHRVYTPTQTGLGERRHLLSRDITLDVFTEDIVNVIEFEELDEVVLVGHSFGGLAASGVADRVPERLRQVVYLDSLLVQPGESPFDGLPEEVVAKRIRAAEETSGGLSLPVPDPSVFGVSNADDLAWLARRLTPHPLGTYKSPLNIEGPIGGDLPKTYIACTDPVYAALKGARAWARAQDDWAWREIATGHDAMVSAPAELTGMLVEIAG